jgi:O-antigen/teichoic acid export membrane protein
VGEASGTSERGLFTRVLSLARGGSSAAAVFQTLGLRVVLLFVNFGTGIIVARSLGTFGRGELAAIALWPSFVAALATLGVPTALRYYTRRQPELAPQLYAASMLLMLAMGFIGGIVGVFVMPLTLHGYDQTVVRMAQVFMIFVPLELLGAVIAAHLEALGKFGRSMLVQLYRNVATLLVLAMLYGTGHMSPLTAALSYTVPTALQVLWLAVRLWPNSLTSIRDVAARSRPLVGYGMRSYGTDVVGALASQLDLAIIIMFLSAAQLGLYTIALTLSRLLNIVQTSLVSVIFTRASGLEEEEGVALISRAARLSTVVSIGLGLVFLLAIPIALPRLYGSEFGAAIPLMPLLTAEAIIGGLGNILKQSFLAGGRPFVVTVIEIGSILCAVGLLFLFVPRMNILGAATALFCTSILRLAMILAGYRFVLGRPIPRLLPETSDFAYIRMKLGGSRLHRAPRLAKEA